MDIKLLADNHTWPSVYFFHELAMSEKNVEGYFLWRNLLIHFLFIFI